MKKKMAVALCVGMVCMTMAFAGCASQGEESANKTDITQEENLKIIGTEETAAYKVTLKNATAKEITGISIKYTDDETYPENMLTDGDIFKVDESRILCYTKPETENTEQKNQAAIAEDEKELEEGYDIQLTFADNTTAELHSFPFEDIEDGELLYADEVAYVSYTSLKTKEKMETKEAELAIQEQQNKAAEEAAAQKAAEEAAAQKSAPKSTPKASNNAPAQTVQQAPQESPSTNQEPSTGAGNADGCIDDGLVY